MPRSAQIFLIITWVILFAALIYSQFQIKQQYEQGMTDMHSLCYGLGEAIIQSKITNKVIKCEALTVASPVHQ